MTDQYQRQPCNSWNDGHFLSVEEWDDLFPIRWFKGMCVVLPCLCEHFHRCVLDMGEKCVWERPHSLRWSAGHVPQWGITDDGFPHSCRSHYGMDVCVIRTGHWGRFCEIFMWKWNELLHWDWLMPVNVFCEWISHGYEQQVLDPWLIMYII